MDHACTWDQYRTAEIVLGVAAPGAWRPADPELATMIDAVACGARGAEAILRACREIDPTADWIGAYIAAIEVWDDRTARAYWAAAGHMIVMGHRAAEAAADRLEELAARVIDAKEDLAEAHAAIDRMTEAFRMTETLR